MSKPHVSSCPRTSMQSPDIADGLSYASSCPQSSMRPRKEQERADLRKESYDSVQGRRPRKASDFPQENRHGNGNSRQSVAGAASTKAARNCSESRKYCPVLHEEECGEESRRSAFLSPFSQTPFESRVFNCLLKCNELPAARGRDVLVCLTPESAGHNAVLRVKCALRKSILLELQADLLRFREDPAKIHVEFNARFEDVAWWVLAFVHYQEMRRFQRCLLGLVGAELEWADSS